MKYKLICFDLQGTLSNADFSDYFWFEVLPLLYKQSKGYLSIEEAKSELKKIFGEYGKYDYRYYSVSYWIKELGLNMTEDEAILLIKKDSVFYGDTLFLIQELNKTNCVIILSTTVRSFIKKELNGREELFQKTYSALDDFNSPGKTKEVYEQLARDYNIEPNEAINIGDNEEMDIVNSSKANWDNFFFDKKIERSVIIEQLRIKLKDNLL